MDHIELSKTLENVIAKIFRELLSTNIKIERTVEQTDSGVIETFKVEFNKK